MIYVKLIRYELKKIISLPFIKILLAVLLVANIIVCCFFARGRDARREIVIYGEYIDKVYSLYLSDPDIFFSEYDRINGDIKSMEFGDELESIYGEGEIGDYFLFSIVYGYATADETYHTEIKDYIKQAQRIHNDLNASGKGKDNFAYRYQSQIIDKYNKLDSVVTLSDKPVYGWDNYFSYTAETVFALLFIIAAGTAIFLNDKKYGFYNIESVCRRGRTSTTVSKIAALLLLCITVSVLFTLSSLMSVELISGFSDITAPVQSVDGLSMVSYHVSILGFLIITALFKLCAIIACCFIAAAAAAFSGNYLISYLSGVIFIAVNLIVSKISAITAGQWKYLNIFSVSSANELPARYRATELFGTSVSMTVILLFAGTGLCILLFALILRFYNIVSVRLRIQRTGKRLKSGKAPGAALFTEVYKFPKHMLSLYTNELYKSRWAYLLLALLLGLKISSSVQYYAPITSSYDRVYRQYIDEIGGEYTDEKADYINGEYTACASVLGRYNDMQQQFWDGKITKSEYKIFLQDYAMAQAKFLVLTDLKTQSAYLRNIAGQGICGWFVYDTGFLKYISQDVDWYLMAFIIILCCDIFAKEYTKTSSRGAVISLIQTTKKGRGRLYLRKLTVSLLSTVPAYIVFKTVDFICLLRNYKLPPNEAPVISVRYLQNAVASTSMQSYFLMTVLLGLAGVMLLSVICLSLSQILKNQIYIYSVAAAVVILPNIIQRVGVTFCQYFDMTQLVNVNYIYKISIDLKISGTYGWLAVFFIFYTAAALGMMYASSRQVRKGGLV